jgi:hypothetical protein
MKENNAHHARIRVKKDALTEGALENAAMNVKHAPNLSPRDASIRGPSFVYAAYHREFLPVTSHRTFSYLVATYSQVYVAKRLPPSVLNANPALRQPVR